MKVLFRGVMPLLLVLLMMVGCSDTQSKTDSSHINIGTAGTAGIFYSLGNGIANVWSDEIDGINASAQSTAGSPQNINYINMGEAQVAFSQNGIALQAWNGEGQFDEPIQSIRALTYLYPNLAYFVVPEGDEITTFQDLKGKTLAPGAIGSGTEQNAREILKLAGIDYEDNKDANVQYVDNAEAASMMIDGKVDMAYIAGGLAHASMVEMATSTDIKILPIEGELKDTITEKYPWYFASTIPANSYKGQSEAVNTVAVGNLLIANKDLDDQAVYDMLDALYGNIDQLANNYKGISELKVEDGLNGVTIPLHSGAVKFFEDNGIDVPDELKPE